MKGSTHLAIGTAIGTAAAIYYPFSWKHAALYVAVSAFSALSADLDGPSLLSSKLGKLSKLLHELLVWTGGLLVSAVLILYAVYGMEHREWTVISVVLLLTGFIAKEGAIRNGLVSLVGCALIYSGWTSDRYWLIGLGLFIAIAPWLRHRGLTHTVWAACAWGYIGLGLEHELQLDGVAAVATAGYMSHLIADTLTPRGVKWLYPLWSKSFKLRL